MGFFGRRDSATSWASVGLVVVVVELSGGVVVVKWRELYSRRFRCAMGALWAQSKPRGLDVGVLTYGFLLFWMKNFSSVRLLRVRNCFRRQCSEILEFSFEAVDFWMRFHGFVFVESVSENKISVDALASFGGESW